MKGFGRTCKSDVGSTGTDSDGSDGGDGGGEAMGIQPNVSSSPVIKNSKKYNTTMSKLLQLS